MPEFESDFEKRVHAASREVYRRIVDGQHPDVEAELMDGWLKASVPDEEEA